MTISSDSIFRNLNDYSYSYFSLSPNFVCLIPPSVINYELFKKSKINEEKKYLFLCYHLQWTHKKPLLTPFILSSSVQILATWSMFSGASLVAQMIQNLPAMQETQVRSLGGEDLLKKGMATNSSILAGKIPWTEEPGGLQSMGLQRVGHDWATNTFTSMFSSVSSLSSQL